MTSIYDARVAEMDASVATAESEEAPLGSLQISAPSWGLAARAYERFLGMPVWVVLGVVWRRCWARAPWRCTWWVRSW
jgi:hypothetical protein